MTKNPETTSNAVTPRSAKADLDKDTRPLRTIPGLKADGDKLTVEITYGGARGRLYPRKRAKKPLGKPEFDNIALRIGNAVQGKGGRGSRCSLC